MLGKAFILQQTMADNKFYEDGGGTTCHLPREQLPDKYFKGIFQPQFNFSVLLEELYAKYKEPVLPLVSIPESSSAWLDPLLLGWNLLSMDGSSSEQLGPPHNGWILLSMVGISSAWFEPPHHGWILLRMVRTSSEWLDLPQHGGILLTMFGSSSRLNSPQHG